MFLHRLGPRQMKMACEAHCIRAVIPAPRQITFHANNNNNNNSTWSHENRVSKHFAIFLNFPCLIACLLCCLLMSFVFACFVVRDLCRSGCGQNYFLTRPPSIFFLFVPTHNSLFDTSDSYLKSVRA